MNGILASMWNFLAGYSGQISLGQQMFIGISGYTLSVSSVYYGVPIFLSLFLGGITSVLFALLISLPVFRMKGVYPHQPLKPLKGAMQTAAFDNCT